MVDINEKKSLQDLVGKKIVKVDDDACNCISLETENGETFVLETECMNSQLGLYGIVLNNDNATEK